MNQKRDWADDPQAQRWLKDTLHRLTPMIANSRLVVSIVPRGETDVKYAVELGMSIMMNKPILLAVFPGCPIPPKLGAIADGIVEVGDLDSPEGRKSMMDAIERIAPKDGDD